MFGFWLACAVVAAIVGSRKGEGFLSFIVGLLLGPIGILFAIFSSGNRKTCPYCKELVNRAAIVCPHCQRDIQVHAGPTPAAPSNPKWKLWVESVLEKTDGKERLVVPVVIGALVIGFIWINYQNREQDRAAKLAEEAAARDAFNRLQATFNSSHVPEQALKLLAAGRFDDVIAFQHKYAALRDPQLSATYDKAVAEETKQLLAAIDKLPKDDFKRLTATYERLAELHPADPQYGQKLAQLSESQVRAKAQAKARSAEPIETGTPMPALSNSDDLDCLYGSQMRPCNETDFKKGLRAIKKSWYRSPEWLRSECAYNQTLHDMTHCLIQNTSVWLASHPGEKAPWLPGLP